MNIISKNQRGESAAHRIRNDSSRPNPYWLAVLWQGQNQAALHVKAIAQLPPKPAFASPCRCSQLGTIAHHFQFTLQTSAMHKTGFPRAYRVFQKTIHGSATHFWLILSAPRKGTHTNIKSQSTTPMVIAQPLF